MSLDWPTQPPQLSNDETVLRGWASTDAEAVYVACQDPEIQRWTTVPVPYERHHASGFVGDVAVEQWSTRRGAPFCISDPHHRLLGACSLVAIDHDRLIGEVGYWIAPGARRPRNGKPSCHHSGRLGVRVRPPATRAVDRTRQPRFDRRC